MGFTPLLGDVSSDDTEDEILELSTASVDMSNRISNLAASICLSSNSTSYWTPEKTACRVKINSMVNS